MGGTLSVSPNKKLSLQELLYEFDFRVLSPNKNIFNFVNSIKEKEIYVVGIIETAKEIEQKNEWKNTLSNGKWLYSDKYETKFEDIYMLNKILKQLGFKELLTIHNSKRTYKYKEYEIVFETIKDLGYFIEV